MFSVSFFDEIDFSIISKDKVFNLFTIYSEIIYTYAERIIIIKENKFCNIYLDDEFSHFNLRNTSTS